MKDISPKNIVVLFASPRKQETWKVVQALEHAVCRKIPATFEYVFLKDHRIEQCRGCFMCLTKGEECCPLKDDRGLIVGKMMKADGVIFATPNYALQVTALLKNFLDRTAYVFHRPCYFTKRAMAVVTQGVYGAPKILDYLKEVQEFAGFIHVPGIALNTIVPRTASEQTVIDKKIEAAAGRFVRSFRKADHPVPSLKHLAIFRMVRSMFWTNNDGSLKDVRYFKEHGWLTSAYYYPVRLGPFRSLFGSLVDQVGQLMSRSRQKTLGGA